MIWRRIYDAPTSRVTVPALIAMRDTAVGDFFLLGLCMYRDGRWLHDDTMAVVNFSEDGEYWWLPEEEVLQPLEALVRDAKMVSAG